MLTGIIMASGLSRRMGENKLLLPYKGRPIFSYIIEVVEKSNLDDIVVVTAHQQILDYCKNLGISCHLNPAPETGQGGTIKVGVEAADKKSDYMFFVADQPMLNTETINTIIYFYLANKGKIIVPEYKNTPANPKIFPNSLRETFLEMTEDVRGNCIVKANPGLVKSVTIEDGRPFFDIDTPEDYERLVNNTIQF